MLCCVQCKSVKTVRTERKNRRRSQEKQPTRYETWLQLWLESKRFAVKESTYVRYCNTVHNHITPYLGHYPITHLNTPLLQDFVTHLRTAGKQNGQGGLAPKTVSDILVLVKESLRYAADQGADIRCAYGGITIRKVQREMRVLTSEETRILCRTLNADHSRCAVGVLLCLYTGIRIGELCALQWSNISLADRTIRVDKTMQRLQISDPAAVRKTRILVSEPKSAASVRTIPMPDFLAEAIAPYQAAAEAYFLTGDIRFIEPRTMQNRFQAYLKRSGIEKANFHALRHTFATRCVEAGFDMKTLSELLGHSSVKITLDKYVHSSMDLKRLNMDKLQKPLPER